MLLTRRACTTNGVNLLAHCTALKEVFFWVIWFDSLVTNQTCVSMHFDLPYYRKLTLVLINIFEINTTSINAIRREFCFPIKEINTKEGVEFINTKINASAMPQEKKNC